MIKWAIRIRYLESKYTGDERWHQHTTKWYKDSSDAWDEQEQFLNSRCKVINESSSSLIHKEN